MSSEQAKGRGQEHLLGFFPPFDTNALFPYIASLTYSLIFLGINWLIAYILCKKKISIKL